jgi:hypothetical protein
VCASLAATAAVYFASTFFLQYLLPGYPTVDWLCHGACTVAAVSTMALPFGLVALGLAATALGLARLDGAVRARSVLAFCLVSPGLVLCLVSPAWSLVPLASALVVLTRVVPSLALELVVAALVGFVAPLPVAVGLLVLLAAWRTRSRWQLPLVAAVGLLAVLARGWVPGWSFTDPVSLPGPLESAGVALVGWWVLVPLVVLSAAAVVDERHRGPGLAVLACVAVALLTSSAPPLRFVGALPLVWLVEAVAPRALKLPALAVLAALQGVVLYHLAHQVPVL